MRDDDRIYGLFVLLLLGILAMSQCHAQRYGPSLFPDMTSRDGTR